MTVYFLLFFFVPLLTLYAVRYFSQGLNSIVVSRIPFFLSSFGPNILFHFVVEEFLCEVSYSELSSFFYFGIVDDSRMAVC
jgi:hypothetical protein